MLVLLEQLHTFFISALDFFQLHEKVAFIGPLYHADLSAFGTLPHPADTSGLDKDVVVGLFEPCVKGNKSKQLVLYFINWNGPLLYIFDPLGKVSDSVAQKIFNFAVLLSHRFQKTSNFKISLLLPEKIANINCSNRGVLVCMVGTKMLLGVPLTGRTAR